MDFNLALQKYLEQWSLYTIPFIIIHVVLVLLIIRFIKKMQIRSGSESFIAQASKQRRTKYNGITLVEQTEKKRRRNSNSYKKLKGNAKSKIEAYFNYKIEELPGIFNYATSKNHKKSKRSFYIYLEKGKKRIKKINMKKALKDFIEITNNYECLDEFVLFLHHLPDAIIKRERYDIYINDHDITIGYDVK